ncbi:2-amino-4-hydroxy-6-hydroxymethyldihydropteridine diphosphokinase [Dictyobacter alpinus]|nr:2-amino-4-hydroxy-6-hydroxymethyldihydropteridine diphosphokinase [Dictyobacter alpinus]
MVTQHTVYLALGSNLGDRQTLLRAAIQELQQIVDIQRISSIYETEPVGYLNQPRFFNLVCYGKTTCTPQELLKRAKAIEQQLGRQPSVRNGPRPVDIDILLYDTRILTDNTLIIPHPRMHERAFVLVPLTEIAPDVVDPRSSSTAQELLQSVSLDGITRTNVQL